MQLRNAAIQDVKLTSSFVVERIKTNHQVTIPANLRKCEETGRFQAFKHDWKPGMANKPHIYWDSDVAKVIEGMSYDEMLHPDPERRQQLDLYVELIVASAGKDGYLNSYFNCVEPEKRWECLAYNHELYCAGHLMEAAVAYFQATGKRNFLDTMARYADYIDSVFGTEPGKRRGVPGHEEIELALCKLADATGDQKYLKLAKYFVDERGTSPNFFDTEAIHQNGEDPWPDILKNQVLQAHIPVREQTEAVGHAVRAMYLYSGMADVAERTGDASLLEACKRLWDSTTEQKMYLTGGIGSVPFLERFGKPWHLPNDFTYVESCAAISVCLFARRMLNITGEEKYAEVLERTLCNAVLSGISLDGYHFFYANRFQIDATVEERLNGFHHSIQREEWFDCSCCPTNFCRFLPQIGSFAFSETKTGMQIDLPFAADGCVNGVKFQVKSGYPYDGKIVVQLKNAPGRKTISLRIPGWCRKWDLSINGQAQEASPVNGYVELVRDWQEGDEIVLNLEMPVRRIYANPHVTSCSGQMALMRGPLVYVLETTDQPNLEFERIVVPEDAEFTLVAVAGLPEGTVAIQFQGQEIVPFPDNVLYREQPPELAAGTVTLTAIPYALWGNRGKVTQLRTWLRTR